MPLQESKNKMLAIAGLLFPSVGLILYRVGSRVNSKHRKTLAEAIRFYRKRLKITQEQLGELADLNSKYIGEVERCEKTISVDALARVATALKVDLTVFFQPVPE
jgi:DNA-binding XRE family transcriptional regulator